MIGEALEAKVLKPTNLKGSRWVPYIFKAVKVSIASGNRRDMARSSAQHSTQYLFYQLAVYLLLLPLVLRKASLLQSTATAYCDRRPLKLTETTSIPISMTRMSVS